MARLSSEEQKALKRLQAKLDAPDPGPVGRTVNVSVNLGDKEQVALARRMGLLDGFDDEESEEEVEDGSDEQADETPRRRGYFTES